MTRPRPVPTPALVRRAAGPIARIGVLVGLHLLVVGHDAPGGEFVAGLVVGASISLHRLAGNSRRAPNRLEGPGIALAVGVLVVAATALAPVVLGGTVATMGATTIDLGAFGSYKATSALAFDIGVLFIVVGLVLSMLHVAVGSEEP